MKRRDALKIIAIGPIVPTALTPLVETKPFPADFVPVNFTPPGFTENRMFYLEQIAKTLLKVEERTGIKTETLLRRYFDASS